jgi:uncharacterized protein with GYD domain
MNCRAFADPREEQTMHFCITANYTPETLKAMAKNPGAGRPAAIEKLLDAAGGKLVRMFHTIAEGPGAIVIFDAESQKAMAMAALVTSSGAMHDIKFHHC